VRVLVTAASKHGATAEIAELVASVLREHGHEVDLRPPERVDAPGAYEAVVVGSAVYGGSWLPAATALLDEHGDALGTRPLWLFSCGLAAVRDPEGAGDPTDLPELAERLGARDHARFDGRLDRSLLNLPERTIVRILRAVEGDFRDWAEIYRWAESVATELAAPAVTR
jgi:menaquinone-dependent protoporphyrinogen oxidase